MLENGNLTWPPPKPVGPPTPVHHKKPELIKPPETSPLQKALADTSLTGGRQFEVFFLSIVRGFPLSIG